MITRPESSKCPPRRWTYIYLKGGCQSACLLRHEPGVFGGDGASRLSAAGRRSACLAQSLSINGDALTSRSCVSCTRLASAWCRSFDWADRCWPTPTILSYRRRVPGLHWPLAVCQCLYGPAVPPTCVTRNEPHRLCQRRSRRGHRRRDFPHQTSRILTSEKRSSLPMLSKVG